MTTPDIDQLFRERARQLSRVVREDAPVPAATVEDACQEAWVRLVGYRGQVRRESAFAWLARTAIREARLEASQDHRCDRLEPCEPDDRGRVRFVDTSFDQRVEARERLHALDALSLRQRRLLWLQGIGLSYAEMARHERCTRRTVERQLERARRRMELA